MTYLGPGYLACVCKLASTVLSGIGGILADYKLAKINIKCILVYFFINKYMLTKTWHSRSILFEKRKWLFLCDIWIIDMVIITPRYENEQIKRNPKSTQSWLTETWNCLVSIRAEGEEFQQVQNSENVEILKQRKWKYNEKANNSTPLEHDFRNFPVPPSLTSS